MRLKLREAQLHARVPHLETMVGQLVVAERARRARPNDGTNGSPNG